LINQWKADRQSRIRIPRAGALQSIPRAPECRRAKARRQKKNMPPSSAGPPIAWNSMQRDHTCDEDPALPVFIALTRPLKNRFAIFE
jgi:hypothetical protein